MDKLDQPPTPEEAEARFRALLDEGGFDQPDEVEYDPGAGELLFLWREQKVAIVIELREDPPSGLGALAPEPPV